MKYRVGESKFGKGIFAEENIPKGKLIWKYKQGENIISFKGKKAVLKHLETLGHKERKWFIIHAWGDGGLINYTDDDSIYWNHCEHPNTGPEGPDPLSTYATRNIKKGEEMFDDYGLY